MWAGTEAGGATGDNNYHVVVADDGETEYLAPHFVVATDTRHPVCYRWESPMNASCIIDGHPTWGSFTQGQVFIKGTGHHGHDFPSQEAQVIAGTPPVAVYPATDSANKLQDKVYRMPAFNIAWEISVDGGGQWHYAGSSDNEVFVYRPGDQGQGTQPPGCSTNWRTVLYLATNGGGTDDCSIVNGVWSELQDLEVLAWDESERQYSRLLTYWADLGAAQNVAGLLETSDGSCLAWSQLMLECLSVHHIPNGIQTAVLTEVLPPAEPDGFVVPNVGGPYGNPEYPLDPDGYIWDVPQNFDLSVTGIPGQGVETPAAKDFANHFIVHRRFGSYPTYTHHYYDPSYGIMWGGEADFTENAVILWLKLRPGENNGPTLRAKVQYWGDGLEVVFDDELIW